MNTLQRQTSPVLQRQVTRAGQPVSKPKPAAPPVYRPQSVPKVLQKKPVAALPRASSGPQRQTPAAPPVYRPAPKKIVQPKVPTIAQPRIAQAASPARPTPRAPGVLQPKPAPRTARPQVVQRHLASRVIQRITDLRELQELDAYYLREIRSIGNPTTRRHREMYDLAKADPTLAAAKKRIRDYVIDWNARLDQAAQMPRPRASVDSPTAGFLPVSSNDLTGALGEHTPPPPRASVGKMGSFKYSDLKRLDAAGRLYAMAEMAAEFGTTIYELQKRANVDVLQRMGVLDYIEHLATQVRYGILDADHIKDDPGLSLNGLVGVYYRYHKFAIDDPIGQRIVTGGFLNKSEIDNPDLPRSLQKGRVRDYFKKRHDYLETLSTGSPLEKTLDMERAQAGAQNTPFIATTSEGAYARQLFGEYPPEKNQRATILTIIGPVCNTFDFEREFEVLDRGFRLFNMRTEVGRAKDKHQAEFGIPDIFIPVGMGKRSPLGFVVAEIQWL
jgi:hypothetical protein